MRPIHLALLLLTAVLGCQAQVVTESPAPVNNSPDDPLPETSAVQMLESEEYAENEEAGSESNPVAIETKRNAESETEKMTEKFVRTDEEWKELLTPEQFYVLRQKGTERPYVNKFDHHFEPGTYACAGCGQELFAADTKFNSGCGWPAFYAAKAGDRVKLLPDHSHGMIRTEVICARCDSHLGHIFNDAPQTPTGQRYCINSVALTFTPAEQPADESANDTAED